VITVAGLDVTDGDWWWDADATMTATADVKGGAGSLGITLDRTRPTAEVNGRRGPTSATASI